MVNIMIQYSRPHLIKILGFFLIFLILLTGCKPNISGSTNSINTNEPKLVVYLLPSNQVVFSEDDLVSYSPENKTFTFTKEGVKKIKSYQPSYTIDAGLYQNSFVMKLGDKEIYHGKFWSGLSSHLEEGIFFSDVVLIGENYPVLRLERISLTSENDFATRELDDSKLIEHFRKINKLK